MKPPNVKTISIDDIFIKTRTDGSKFNWDESIIPIEQQGSDVPNNEKFDMEKHLLLIHHNHTYYSAQTLLMEITTDNVDNETVEEKLPALAQTAPSTTIKRSLQVHHTANQVNPRWGKIYKTEISRDESDIRILLPPMVQSYNLIEPEYKIGSKRYDPLLPSQSNSNKNQNEAGLAVDSSWVIGIRVEPATTTNGMNKAVLNVVHAPMHKDSSIFSTSSEYNGSRKEQCECITQLVAKGLNESLKMVKNIDEDGKSNLPLQIFFVASDASDDEFESIMLNEINEIKQIFDIVNSQCKIDRKNNGINKELESIRNNIQRINGTKKGARWEPAIMFSIMQHDSMNVFCDYNQQTNELREIRRPIAIVDDITSDVVNDFYIQKAPIQLRYIILVDEVVNTKNQVHHLSQSSTLTSDFIQFLYTLHCEPCVNGNQMTRYPSPLKLARRFPDQENKPTLSKNPVKSHS